MRIKKGFVMRTVMGTPIIVAEGRNAADFNKLVSLNATAAFAWEKFVGTEFKTQDVANAFVEEYGIDEPTALRDAADLVSKWEEIGVIE